MNIIVKTASGKYIVRPDTTWEKDNEDFFPPDYISKISFTPVLFARISKPGKSIGVRLLQDITIQSVTAFYSILRTLSEKTPKISHVPPALTIPPS